MVEADVDVDVENDVDAEMRADHRRRLYLGRTSGPHTRRHSYELHHHRPCTRIEAVRADEHAFAADLVLHTHTHTPASMRNSNQQHPRILAAHVLSLSCRHTGCVSQSLPIQERAVRDRPYVQLMRMRAAGRESLA